MKRFHDSGEVPPLSPAQLEAIEVLEATAAREAMHMVLVSPLNQTNGHCRTEFSDKRMQEVGDVQFVSGVYILHARTGQHDYSL